MGNFETSVFASGSWQNGEGTDGRLRIAVHDSDFATVDYRPVAGSSGRFYLGFQPRDYFEDPAASDPVDLQAESSRFSQWASAVLGTNIAATELLVLMAPAGVEDPLDVVVEDTLVRLLNRLGMPLPTWLATEGPFVDTDLAAQEPGRDWAEIARDVAGFLKEMTSREYLLVTYDIGLRDYSVYGQFAINEGNFQCEIVSEQFLPADVWPINDTYLRHSGWSAPENGNPNWSMRQDQAERAADSVLTAMRSGLGCADSQLIKMNFGRF
ncbi:TY-Chap domain-containing protein [Arthrobacter sp. HLT1-20]